MTRASPIDSTLTRGYRRKVVVVVVVTNVSMSGNTCNGSSCVRFATSDTDIYIGCVRWKTTRNAGAGGRAMFDGLFD